MQDEVPRQRTFTPETTSSSGSSFVHVSHQTAQESVTPTSSRPPSVGHRVDVPLGWNRPFPPFPLEDMRAPYPRHGRPLSGDELLLLSVLMEMRPSWFPCAHLGVRDENGNPELECEHSTFQKYRGLLCCACADGREHQARYPGGVSRWR